MNTWRAQDDDIQDDMFCAIEAPEIEDWIAYMRYCEQAKERREIVLEFEDWLEAKDAV